MTSYEGAGPTRPAPAVTYDSTAWMDRALCVGADPDLFFSDGGNPAKAKQICGMCPVATDCEQHVESLEHGQHSRYRYGTWAAKSGKARAHTRTVVPGDPTRDLRIIRMAGQNWDARRIADEMGCNERTVYRVLKRAREES